MKIRIYDAGRRDAQNSGYGVMIRYLAAELKKLGHEIVYFPRGGESGDDEDVVLWPRPPHYIKYKQFDKPGATNVFFTMHESESFEGWKEDWPALLNRCDAIITPTEWNKGVFEKHGITVPITVIPLGIDTKVWHGGRTYRFSIMSLHEGLGSNSSRENWRETLTAYHEAFQELYEKDVLLTIKSWDMNVVNYLSHLASLRRKGAPEVRVVELDLTNSDLNGLYAQHWFFVKNANREGWSLPLWEAMACGLRVAYTDLPVFGRVPKWAGRRFPLGDVDALRDIFLDEFRHWKKRKGFFNQFKWDRTAEAVEGVLIEARDRRGQ